MRFAVLDWIFGLTSSLCCLIAAGTVA